MLSQQVAQSSHGSLLPQDASRAVGASAVRSPLSPPAKQQKLSCCEILSRILAAAFVSVSSIAPLPVV